MAAQVSTWTEQQVADWLKINGLESYANLFIENDITGSVLLLLDHEILKEMNITSVGKRVLILKAVKELAESQNILTSPNTEVSPFQNLENSIKDKDAVIMDLQKQLLSVKDDLLQIQKNYQQAGKQDSLKSTKDGKDGKEKTLRGILKSENQPQGDKLKNKSLMFSVRERLGSFSEVKKKPRPHSNGDTGVIRIYGNSLNEFENYKTFATTVNENCQQILQTALKKFGIKGDWKQYTLFMHFKGKERSLRYNEIPLLLKRGLRDVAEEPRFSIRNIRQFDDGESVHSNVRDNESKEKEQKHAEQPSKQDELEKLMGEEDSPPDAVGIYEYVAMLDDELSICIGDSVKVIRRATGWWYVQKGTMFGWAPSGCLDIAEENETASDFKLCEGDVLYDYSGEGANELAISKGDRLLIVNRHQHWLLADYGGQRGWVPSCYVSIDDEDSVWNKSNLPLKPNRNESPEPRPSFDATDEPLSDETLEEELAREEEEEENQKIQEGIQTTRQAVQRLSKVLENFPGSGQESNSELRQTIKKLLEEIDTDLSELPEKTQGENSENVRERISTMMQELEKLERKCKTLSTSSFEEQSRSINSRLQSLSNLKFAMDMKSEGN